MTSLHPPSFHRNDFCTCSTHLSFGTKPQHKINLCATREHAHIHVPHAHAHADNAPLRARACVGVYTRACCGVVQCLPLKNPTIYRRNLRREKNDRLVSMHTSVDYGNVWSKNSAEACSGKEMAGLLKKMMMMKNMTSGKIISMK